MRPLREFFTSSRTAPDPRPIEPVVVLAVASRAAPTFDAAAEGDPRLFGLEASALAALGPRLGQLLELAYEVFEGSAVPFERLGALPLAVVHAGPEALDPATLLEVFGLRAESSSLRGGALEAVHAAARVCRGGEADLGLVLVEHPPGATAVLLARAERAGREEWRARCLLTGSAASPDRATARTWASARGGVAVPDAADAEDVGVAGLVQAVADIQSGASGLRWVCEGDVCLVLAAPEPVTASEIDPRFLGLSARSPAALGALARGALASATSEVELQRVAAEASRRPAFEHRVAVPMAGLDSVRVRLGGWANGAGGAHAAVVRDEPPVVFVFPPSGAVGPRATDGLYGAEPAFRDALNRCDRIARPILHRSLLSVLFPGPGREDETGDPAFDHALTFAIGWALAELLRTFGVEPAHTVGCGVGELAAAAVAGAISLEDGLRLAAERGKLVRTLEDPGVRAVFGLSEEAVSSLFGGIDQVDVVALPRPGRVVIGGTAEAVRTVLDRADQRGIRYAELDGNPLHGPLVDPIVPAFQQIASDVAFQPTGIAVWSTATGRRLRYADAHHWVATLRAPLRLTDAIGAAAAAGGRVFLELGARPTIGAAGEQALHHVASRWIPVLAPETEDGVQFREVLAELWSLGVRATAGSAPGTGIGPLPAYPFDRRRLDPAAAEPAPADPAPHPPEVVVAPAPAPAPAPAAAPTPADEAPWRPAALSGPASWPPPPPTGIAFEDEETAHERELLDLARQATPAPAPARPFADDASGSAHTEITLAELTVDEGLTFRPPPLEDDTAAHQADLLPAGLQADLHQADLLPESALVGHAGPVWTEAWATCALGTDDPVAPTTWVLLADRGGVAEALRDALVRENHRVVRVVLGGEGGDPADDRVSIPDPIGEEGWMNALELIGSLQAGPVRVVHLWTLDPDAPSGAGWPSVVALAHEILHEGLPAALHLVTRGGARDGSSVLGAGLWGVAGLLAAETGVLGGVVDLDPAGAGAVDPAEIAALARHLSRTPTDGSVPQRMALRGGWLAQEIVGAAEPPPFPTVDPAATWLIAGGADAALTLELANALVASGARRLMVVSGAAAPPPDLVKAALEFQKRAVTFQVLRANPADPKGVEQIRQRLAREAKVAGLVLFQGPTPRSFRELSPADDAPKGEAALAAARGLVGALPDDAHLVIWSCNRALDGTAGNGVGACVAAGLGALVRERRASGRPAGLVHGGQPAELAPGESIRLALALGAAGGVWGLWPA